MNNPSVIGCSVADAQSNEPLVRAQVIIKSDQAGMGRIDVIGLAPREDSGFELRIFELKNGEIDVAAVEQLIHYLKNWQPNSSARKQVRDWALRLSLKGVDETTIDDILDQPIGVLIGTGFKAEAIRAALDSDLRQQIRGLRLARFRGTSKSEYYVIAEDQIGTIRTKKRYWSWGALIKAGLIDKDDTFILKETGLIVRPDPERLDYNWIMVIFDEPSTQLLLSKEEEILAKAEAQSDAYVKRWVPRALDALRNRKSMAITLATGLSFFAFGSPTTYWGPADYWIHQKSGKFLTELKGSLFKKK
ncbi:MAG TPA: hypothetical protein PLL62_08080 [Candidatus Saccharicenans sp.]|nr:hypothetical protein [Candidatus Saccharicenans sp.]HQM75177.1 hypothetical protein [Candidatus Saccharicenans sp.]